MKQKDINISPKDRIIKDFDKLEVNVDGNIMNLSKWLNYEQRVVVKQFLIQSIKEVREEIRKETLEIIDTELEVRLQKGENDYDNGWNDACLEWDLLLNKTIDRVKRGVLSITNKEKQNE